MPEKSDGGGREGDKGVASSEGAPTYTQTGARRAALPAGRAALTVYFTRQLSVPGIGLMPLRTFFFLGYVSFFYRKMQGKRVLQEKSKFPAIISHVLKEIIKVRILAQYVFPKKFNKLILGQFFWHFFL